MHLDFGSELPIYQQITRSIEDDIVLGVLPEEGQIPSTTEISVGYKVNPATVAKGYNLLVEQGILYKRRGVGMFVKEGAREILLAKRREDFYGTYVSALLKEAEKLQISVDDVIALLQRAKADRG